MTSSGESPFLKVSENGFKMILTSENTHGQTGQECMASRIVAAFGALLVAFLLPSCTFFSSLPLQIFKSVDQMTVIFYFGEE